MTCTELAAQYVRETSQPIPSPNASIADRSFWLLTESWYCMIEGKLEDAKTCDTQSVYVSPYTSIGVPKTILQEDGFAAWVNERGQKCINRLTGVFWIDQPSFTTKQPKTFCVNACYNATSASSACFECVKNALENPANNADLGPTACPGLFNGTTITTVDTNLMQQSLACNNCLGINSANAVKPVQTTDPTTGQVNLGAEYQQPGFDNMWCCITGSFPLSTGAIIGIVLSCLVVLALVIGLTVYYVKKRKSKSTGSSESPNTVSFSGFV